MNNRRRNWFRGKKQGGINPDSFIMTFTLAANDSITLPLISAGAYNFVVNWGDGTSNTITAFNQAERVHSYAGQPAGDYIISITGVCTAWSFSSVNTSRLKIKTVDQWGDTSLNNLIGGFQSCINLNSISNDLKYQGTSLVNTFNSCSSLNSIPLNLLQNSVLVNNFFATFQGIPITTIPTGLFNNVATDSNFLNTFQNCTSLTSIPSGLFDNCTGATNFQSTFNNCRFSSIPTDLFRFNVSVTTFLTTFANNPILNSIPLELFRYNAAVTSFQSTFLNCTSLTSIPSDLFQYNVNVTNFVQTFRNTRIVSAPLDLFRYNINATNFLLTFSINPSLLTIPDDLFRYNINATNYGSTFIGCSLLNQSITNFVLNMDMTKVTTTNQMFSGCTSITGNGQDLIDKPKAAGYVVSTDTNSGSYRTFFDCTSLTDFATIPAEYK